MIKNSKYRKTSTSLSEEIPELYNIFGLKFLVHYILWKIYIIPYRVL